MNLIQLLGKGRLEQNGQKIKLILNKNLVTSLSNSCCCHKHGLGEEADVRNVNNPVRYTDEKVFWSLP